MPWRLMTQQDLERVTALADRIHVDHPEAGDVFAERQRLYPQGCHVLAEGDNLVGYALAHPWRLGEPPSLNARLGKLPLDPTTYYIHDVALLPEARGEGHAVRITGILQDHARVAGFGNLSLVAVNGSQAFWERRGFRSMPLPGLRTKLLSYGQDAAPMRCDLIEPGR